MDNIKRYIPYIPTNEDMIKANQEALKKIEKLVNDYKELEKAYGDYVFKVLENVHEREK